MSDHIVVMRDGRIAQQGSPTDLYDLPASAFVADFIGKQNFIEGMRDGNELAMTTLGGRRLLAGRTAAGTTASGRVLGAVRPEHVVLTPQEPLEAVNRLQGRMAATVMLGDTVEHVLALPDGTEFLCRMPRSRDTGLAPGATAWAHWSPEVLALLPHEDLDRGRPSRTKVVP